MNTFGDKIKITVFGQSHADAIGVVIDGLPAGESVDTDAVNAFLSRRAPGQNEMSTASKESDKAEFLSGLVNGKTCGAPVSAVIYNKDMRSKDYSELAYKPRPSHADYPARVRFGENYDLRGGGQFSGRLTAPLCIAGSVIMQLLERRGIFIGAHIYSICAVKDEPFDMCTVTPESFEKIRRNNLPVIDYSAGIRMRERILQAKSALDSVGGVIECAAIGLDAGFGEPCFCGVENLVSQAVFAIPAVKGIEFGAGFGCSEMTGSENNDEYYYDGERVKTRTNNAGGICGGMTTGMPVIFRAAFKPTPSIAREQNTVDLKNGTDAKLEIKGRHDPCIVQRAVPCVESAAAIALAQFVF